VTTAGEGGRHRGEGFEGTSLHCVSFNGHGATVQQLLEKGANVEANDGYRQTALHSEVQKGHDASVRLLVEKGANAEVKVKDGETGRH
jgi:ankyrin repeat protein